MQERDRNERLPTILVVNPDGETLDADRFLLANMRARPSVCLGPERARGCPMLKDCSCPIEEEADGILLQLDLDLPDHRRLLRRYALEARVPVAACVSEAELERWRHLLDGLHVIVGPPTQEDIQLLVDDAAAHVGWSENFIG